MGSSSGGVPGAPNPPVRLEGPRLPLPHQREEAVPGQPGRGLPDIRHMFDLLRALARHPHPLLEDIPDGQEENPKKKGTEEPAERGLDQDQQQREEQRRVPLEEEEVPQGQEQEELDRGSAGRDNGDGGATLVHHGDVAGARREPQHR